MNKILLNVALISTMASVFGLTACTRVLSEGLTGEGHIDPANLVFPELDDAWQKDGQFPNTENLLKIKPGIAKDELYYLIGRPHFSEAQYAKEWDYIFKFYQEDNSVKVCQYKVMFDRHYKGQEFYWLPADCAKYAQPKQPQQVITQVINNPPAVQPVVRQEKITLDADALFQFNQSDLSNMLPQGRNKLDELAQKLQSLLKEGDIRIHLSGHTDRLGSHEYNADLSQRRANTVLSYLASRGINPAIISASGAGEDYPVVQCSTNMPRAEQINCLQPNRRVEVDVVIHQFTR